ncbi:hypothetical protein D3C72_2210260 [compost metagenome]
MMRIIVVATHGLVENGRVNERTQIKSSGDVCREWISYDLTKDLPIPVTITGNG